MELNDMGTLLNKLALQYADLQALDLVGVPQKYVDFCLYLCEGKHIPELRVYASNSKNVD